jgi:hypothetical protein
MRRGWRGVVRKAAELAELARYSHGAGLDRVPVAPRLTIEAWGNRLFSGFG